MRDFDKLVRDRECLEDLNMFIDEIHFSKIPDLSLIEALYSGNDEPKIHLPFYHNSKYICNLTSIAECEFSKDVISANLETDLFEDHEDLYHFTKIRFLILSCHNSKAEYVDSRELDKMQLAITNLQHLKKLTIDVVGMNNKAQAQIKEALIFPCSKFELDFIFSRGEQIKFRKLLKASSS